MSKDPTKPDPDQGKPTPKASKKTTETTEADLWDLNDGDSGFIPKKSVEESTTRIPSRRIRETVILTKVPTERSIDIPDLTPLDETEETAAPEAAKPLPATEAAKPATKPAYEAGDEDAEIPAGEDEGAEAIVLPSLSSLTKTERIAISGLAAALILAAILAIVHFSSSVPTRSPIAEKPDFPVSGKLIEIRAASTYWRKPVATGENPDTVRRGTALIPVVKLALNAKSGTVRVFFRDADGIVIGDAINRNLSGTQDLVIPATAGFDDIGMHAAYRTGEQEPWIVEVYEGPSRSADRKDFRKVFQTQISTDIR